MENLKIVDYLAGRQPGAGEIEMTMRDLTARIVGWR